MHEENLELFTHENSMPKSVEEELSTLNLSDNNIAGRIAHLRDTFISAEKEYVLELLKEETVRQMINDVNWYKSEEIFAAAQDLVEKVENNLIPYEQMEKVEIKLVILLAAIKDKVLVKELIRRYSPQKENEHGIGRSR